MSQVYSNRNLPGLLHGVLLLALLVGSFAGAALPAPAAAASASIPVLPGSAPNFYKLAVKQTGMYSVTYDYLQGAQLPVDTMDLQGFRIYEQGSEIAHQVIDADASGTFTSGDSIHFYGRTVWTPYTATNLYWLTYNQGTGRSMMTRDAPADNLLSPVTTFLETLHLEQDLRWMKALPLTGVADRWYWNLYQGACSTGRPGKFATTVNTPGVAAGPFTATLTPRVRGFNDVSHTALFDFNGVSIGQATFSGKEEYVGTLAFAQSTLLEGANTLTLTSPCATTATIDWGVVNWYDLSYHRTYAAPATGQFAFAVDTAQDSLITLLGMPLAGTEIYDITDSQNPVWLTGLPAAAAAGGSAVHADLAFSHTAGAAARYIAASTGQWLTPDSITADVPSSLRGPSTDEPAASGADWIIITHPTFLAQAEQLAAHRRTYQHYRTAVVAIQDVYDEFNGGLKDQEAIRLFLRYAYENWPRPAPQFVVLLGDGNYDPRNVLGNNTVDFIPPYLAAVNPFDGVVAADNRYVAYDPVAPAVNPAPFMALGRLPATSLTDAQVLVDKIIAYETQPPHADWNTDVLFIADNADTGGTFPDNSDEVAEDTFYLPAEYDRQKVYYGVNYTDKTAANTAIVDAIKQGALFVNYHGHASLQNWSGEPLLALTDQARLTNAGKYPIFLPMTCLEGDFTEPSPSKQSFGESIVRLAGGGAVASWSPSGKGVASGHDVIYRGFYEAIFDQGITLIGPATTYAKQALAGSTTVFKDLIDSYTLFGDPAMPLDLPRYPLGGQIFNDTNGNGVLDEGETPLAGVSVTVTDGSGATVASLTSDAQGKWQANLRSGTYTVTVPANFSGLSVTSNSQVTVGVGGNGPTVNFGYATPTGIEIEFPQARWTRDGIRITWATRLEDTLQEFHLYRTTDRTQQGIRINAEPIGREAPPGEGASYAYLDAAVKPGQQVYYWLVVVPTLGEWVWVGPIQPFWPYTLYLPPIIR